MKPSVSKRVCPGARLAQINEVAQGDIWDDQRMKELASREPISARYLHKEAFQFNPTHKLWVRGNHMPGAHDDGEGFWRRFIFIHFSQTIQSEQIIPDLDRRIIEQELSGGSELGRWKAVCFISEVWFANPKSGYGGKTGLS